MQVGQLWFEAFLPVVGRPVTLPWASPYDSWTCVDEMEVPDAVPGDVALIYRRELDSGADVDVVIRNANPDCMRPLRPLVGERTAERAMPDDEFDTIVAQVRFRSGPAARVLPRLSWVMHGLGVDDVLRFFARLMLRSDQVARSHPEWPASGRSQALMQVLRESPVVDWVPGADIIAVIESAAGCRIRLSDELCPDSGWDRFAGTDQQPQPHSGSTRLAWPSSWLDPAGENRPLAWPLRSVYRSSTGALVETITVDLGLPPEAASDITRIRQQAAPPGATLLHEEMLLLEPYSFEGSAPVYRIRRSGGKDLSDHLQCLGLAASTSPRRMTAGQEDPELGKTRFLVCYDYGMGGVWGVVAAESAQAIRRLNPELTVYSHLPQGMDPTEYARILAYGVFPLSGATDPTIGSGHPLRAVFGDRQS